MMKLTGAVAAGTALAGCSGGEDTEAPADNDGDTPDDGGGTTDGGSPESFDGWFDGVDNYDGVVDETGADGVSVTVGAGADGLLFDPAAIRVSSGTTVTWEWTNKGGSHNVVADDGSFESELVGTEGYTFEHTFDATGEFKYSCEPHKTLGMKGVVLVE